MKDDDFRDWRRDEELPREPGAQPGDSRAESEASPLPSQTPPPSRSVASGGRGQGQGSRPGPGPGGVRAQPVACPNCHYNLTGSTIGMACPECGMIVGSGLLGAQGMPTSGKAVASLVLGILSIVGCCMGGLPGVVCGGLAVIFSRGVKTQILRGEVHPSSQGMAVAGFVCGLIGLILGALFLAVILLEL